MQSFIQAGKRLVSQQEAPGIEYAPGRHMIGRSPTMQRVYFLIERYASSSAPVLVTGATGTGKELAARAIHYYSGRTGPFITVNCASVNDGLFESEFFGHRRGAFTGALADRAGWFEQADGGTLFLDEVGEMPLNQQAKLLRAIEDRSVIPVGGTQPVPVSARIVAATNVDLANAVTKRRFRDDLLDRLNVLPLRMPSLAERPQDFAPLVEHFLAAANGEEGAEVEPVSTDILGYLQITLGAGSIRRLKNAIRRAVVVKGQGVLTTDDFAGDVERAPSDGNAGCSVHIEADGGGKMHVGIEMQDAHPYKETMGMVGRALTDASLKQHGGHVGRAMQALGMSKDVWYRVRRSCATRRQQARR